MKTYEEKMQWLRETGMFYKGVKKDFTAKVDGTAFFSLPGAAVDAFGYYQDENEKYTAFVTDEERGRTIWRKTFETEEEVVQYLIDFAERNNFRHYREEEQRHFEEKSKVIIAYLQKEYGYSEKKAQEALDYLLQVPQIAFEFYWFVQNGEFVSDQFAANYYGYTAKKLSEETYLTVLGAFNYLVYLARKPEEALENLKKGLPKRKIYSDEELKEVQKTMDEQNVVPVEETAKPEAEQVAPEQVQPEAVPVEETKAEEVAPAEEAALADQSAVLEKLEAVQAAKIFI